MSDPREQAERAMEARRQAEAIDKAEINRESARLTQNRQAEAQRRAQTQRAKSKTYGQAPAPGPTFNDAKGEIESKMGQDAISKGQGAQSQTAGSGGLGRGMLPEAIVKAVTDNKDRRERDRDSPPVKPVYDTTIDATGSVEVQAGESARAKAQGSQKMIRSPNQEGGALDKAVTGLDNKIMNLQGQIRVRADSIEAKAFESKNQGDMAGGLVQITGSQLLRAGSGFIGGVTYPLNPLAWARSARDVETVITDPVARDSAIQGFLSKPHQGIAEIGGGIIGGITFGAGAEALVKRVRGPSSAITKLRTRSSRVRTSIKRRSTVIKERFGEAPGVRLVDDFSLSQYEVSGGGSWPKSGSTGMGKVIGRTGGDTQAMMVPPGTPTRPVFKLFKERGLSRTVSMGTGRGGMGSRYAFDRIMVPATSPGLTSPGGALGLLSQAKLRASNLSREAQGDIVNLDNYKDGLERFQRRTSPGPTRLDTSQKPDTTPRGDVIWGGLNLIPPQEVINITDDPPRQKDPFSRTTQRPIQEPRQTPSPKDPGKTRPPSPIPYEREPPPTKVKPRIRVEKTKKKKKAGMMGPWSLKSGLKRFNVKKARDVV